MMARMIPLRISILLCLSLWCMAEAGEEERGAYFADGYHGGIYGHYPMWQARFMVEKLKEHPDWKINLEIEPETWDRVAEQDAENFKRLQDYYRETGRLGRIEFVNPAYAQPYAYNISGESLIRHFTYGMAKVREHFPEATFKTYSCEEPCFTSCMPQVLKSLGYEYAVLRNPDTCWGGYTTGFGKDLVRWLGPDGTGMLAVPRYGCEGLEEGSTWQTESWDNAKPFIQQCFDDGILYPVGMCFQDAGWRGGPWLGSAVRHYYQPSRYVTWTDYIEMVAPKVIADDWHFTIEDVKPGLVWGAQVLQKLAREIRVTENRLIQAEKMAAMDNWFSGTVYPQAQLDEAWRGLMLAQHHDCWIVPYNGRPGQTWADKVSSWTSSANQIADQIIEAAFEHLADQPVDEPGAITVFNTLGTGRTGMVSVELPDGYDPRHYQVYDMQGNRVVSQAGEGRELLIWAKVPAMGYSSFTLKAKPQADGPKSAETLNEGILQIETAYYRATYDSRHGGTITSLLDRQMGDAQLVQNGKGLNGLCGYRYDEKRFVNTFDHPAQVTVVEDGELLVRVRVVGRWAGHPYTQLITFYQQHPRIDCELTIDWQGQPKIGAYSQQDNYRQEDRAKAFYNDSYKLHVQFPLQGVGDRLIKNAPFDVCESRLDNTLYDRWDQIKHNVILNWVEVTDRAATRGVALFSDHTTSFLHSDELPLGLTVQYVGKGLWGRDYRVQGPTHIRYRLMPHQGNWEQARIEAESGAWNEPLLGRWGAFSNKPKMGTLLEVADGNCHITSITMNRDGLIVRFFNTSSVKQRQDILWHDPLKQAEWIELNGQVIAPALIEKRDEGNVTSLSVPQFGLRTLRSIRTDTNR